jgi:fibronectin type 3 domain-containing protein
MKRSFLALCRVCLTGAAMALCLPACSSDDSDAEAIAAPSELRAEIVNDGVHLTWKDNSTGEAHFMLFRKMKGESDAQDAYATPAANSTSYQDDEVESGMTYLYKVHAMDADGVMGKNSNEFEIAVP